MSNVAGAVARAHAYGIQATIDHCCHRPAQRDHLTVSLGRRVSPGECADRAASCAASTDQLTTLPNLNTYTVTPSQHVPFKCPVAIRTSSDGALVSAGGRSSKFMCGSRLGVTLNLYRLVSEGGRGRSANKTCLTRATLQYVTMFRLSMAMPAASRARSPSSVDARAHVLFRM